MKFKASRAVQACLEPAALPRGFSLYGLRCGISAAPGKKDLALFYSHAPARVAAVFTRNLVKAAPVLLSQRHARGGLARAVLINSGCANACTGPQGAADARWSAQTLAAGLKVPLRQVLVGSTGVIGHHLPRLKLKRGLAQIIRRARAGRGAPKDALEAIMTTDTRCKAARARFLWQGRAYTLWGCVKGAGMIHPNMATMLSVLLTDIGLPAGELRAALGRAVERTFNRVSVDGDTSTNDSVFLLANGAVGSFARVPAGLRRVFRSALREVCLSLSTQIAADGEGATRTAWVFVQGAPTEAKATRLAATVATSPLVGANTT